MRPLVVSLNPAIDAEWRLPRILPEEKNELTSDRRWPGGKGVNVARWLNWLGQPAHLFLPLGGSTGDELAAGLTREKLEFTRFELRQPTRVNVVVTPDEGPQYRFNPTWPRVSGDEATRLRNQVAALAAAADPVILSGTLAFGAPPDTYARLVRSAARAGRRTVLDCDRQPFALAVRERPWLVKPNEFELAEWARKPLSDTASRLKAARELAMATGGWVIVSRGSRGAWMLHVEKQVELSAIPAAVRPRNRVGAGDALLAGAVAAVLRTDDPAEWLRAAVATGTAATQVPPGELPSRALWNRIHKSVRVRSIRG
jgi:1-phosphofructokinase family hexose kinase